jgi:hypothetical protein
MKQPNDEPGAEMTDDELAATIIEQRNKGNLEEADEFATTLLFRRYGALIDRLANKYCDDSAKEKSPLTEIYLHLRTEWTQKDEVDGQPWDYLSNFDGGSFKAYLYRTVKNYYLGGDDQQCTLQSQQGDTGRSAEAFYGPSNGEKTIKDNTEGHKLKFKIEGSPYHFGGAIPALKMRYYGVEYSDIKDEIGFEGSTNALRQRVYRLRQDLRDRLSDWPRPDWL